MAIPVKNTVCSSSAHTATDRRTRIPVWRIRRTDHRTGAVALPDARETRHRIGSDLGEGGQLNTALEEWWTLEFPDFRDQAKKAFKRDIPLKERDEWEAYLTNARKHHERLTGEIVTLEMGLNEVAYAAFGLTPEERTLIEQATKYPYGSV